MSMMHELGSRRFHHRRLVGAREAPLSGLNSSDGPGGGAEMPLLAAGIHHSEIIKDDCDCG